MRKLRLFTTAAVLSLSLLTVGCGDRENAMDNGAERQNVSTRDMARTDRDMDLRRVNRDNDLGMNRNNVNRDNAIGMNRNNTNRDNMTGMNDDTTTGYRSQAVRAPGESGYITPSPVATTTPTTRYTRLCPCPNQGTGAGTAAPAPRTATPAPAPTAPRPTTQTGGGTLDATELRVIELTNVERRKNGLRDLQADTSLANVAQAKSNDMLSKNYFSHTSPTYGSPFDMMRSFGVSYSYAGENIAKGQRSADEVVQAWMNSPGHRANILNGKFTHIGVGFTSSQNYWTQMFVGR